MSFKMKSPILVTSLLVVAVLVLLFAFNSTDSGQKKSNEHEDDKARSVAYSEPEASNESPSEDVLAETSDRNFIPETSPQQQTVASVKKEPNPRAAPNFDEVALSDSLQRSLQVSAALRSESYSNPSSQLNAERIQQIRTLRKNRQSSEP
jgi:hypothetical protein